MYVAIEQQDITKHKQHINIVTNYSV